MFIVEASFASSKRRVLLITCLFAVFLLVTTLALAEDRSSHMIAGVSGRYSRGMRSILSKDKGKSQKPKHKAFNPQNDLWVVRTDSI